MRINLPVIDHEAFLNEGETIVSKTDLKGHIIYVNQTFLDISGFSIEELMGKAHNIVRHPDMPPAAFEDLWNTLKSGRPWSGMVKNRCKDGSFYWVRAEVSPVRENGAVTGFLSVRFAPSRADVEAAEQLYKDMREGNARGMAIIGGAVVKCGWLAKGWRRLTGMSFQWRLIGLIAFMSSLAAGVTLATLVGLGKADSVLREVFEEHTVPLSQLSQIRNRVLENRILMGELLAKPQSEVVESNIAQMERNSAEIAKIWEAFAARPTDADEKKLIAQIVEKRQALVQEGAQCRSHAQR